jgi:hypothetical protein
MLFCVGVFATRTQIASARSWVGEKPSVQFVAARPSSSTRSDDPVIRPAANEMFASPFVSNASAAASVPKWVGTSEAGASCSQPSIQV